jgi:hypothetical protein
MTNITNLVSTYNLEKDGVSVTLEVRHHNKTFEINPGKNAVSASDMFDCVSSLTDDQFNERLHALRMTVALVHEAVVHAEYLLQDKVKVELHASALPGPEQGPIGPSGGPGNPGMSVEDMDSHGDVYYLSPEDKQKEIKVVLHDKPVLVKMSDVHYVVSTNEGRRTMFMTDSGRSYRCLSTYNHVLAQIMSPGKKYE